MPITTNIAEVRKLCLQYHNEHRARHGSPALAADQELDRTAQKWAEELAKTGQFAHSKAEQRNNAGENISSASKGFRTAAAITPSTPAVIAKEAVDSWYSEKEHYTDYENGKFSLETGHFTQVVWKGSTRLGTGVAFRTYSDKGWEWLEAIVVCQYAPAGNVTGEFRTNVLKLKT